jgi:DNA polymerase-3 subunit alpha
MNRRQMEYLIKAGAFDSLHKNRGQLTQSLDLIIGHNNATQREKESRQVNLFGGDAAQSAPLPSMPACDDWVPMERMEHENDALGFYLSSHPIQGYRSVLQRLAVTPSQLFLQRLGSNYAPMKVAGLVSKLKIRTSEKGRFAFVTLSDEGGVFEISIFKEELLGRYRAQLESGVLIVAQVDGKREEGAAKLIMQSMQPLEEAIAGVQAQAMPKKLRIALDSSQAVTKLRGVLGEAGNSGAKITLCAVLDEKRQVEIALSGHYVLNPTLLMQIPALEGILESTEAA